MADKKRREPIGFIDHFTRKAAMRYQMDLGGPVALGIYLCLKYSDDAEACRHQIDPNQYICAGDFRTDYLASKLLSKYTEGPEGHKESLDAKAIEKFLLTEKRLREHRPRLNHILFGVTNNYRDHRAASVLHLAREKIGKWLGSFFDVFDPLDCEFGPGASTSVPGREAHPANKFIAKEASPCCKNWVDTFMGYLAPGTRWNTELLYRDSSRMSIVDKNFDNKRTIACEPDWSIFFQKGCGAALRKRLRRVGLDLNHAAERHEVLAKTASILGELCTVDLSSASDSVLTALVRFLLPDDWFYALDSLRTTSVELPGHPPGTSVPLIKFSSMGNGFTFELESLIFYAVSKAACEIMEVDHSDVSVFGDDIIIPSTVYQCLTDALEAGGFVINTAKTFSEGYFRESCGAHYFDGWDVKPIYLKAPLSHDTEKYKFCNTIRRATVRCFGTPLHCHRFRNTYHLVTRSIRKLLRIPDGVGDGGLVSTFDEVAPNFRRSKGRGKKGKVDRPDIRGLARLRDVEMSGWEGYRVRCWLPVARRVAITHRGQMDACLYNLRRTEKRRISVSKLGHSNQARNYDVLGRCYSQEENRRLLQFHGDIFACSPDASELTTLVKLSKAGEDVYEGQYTMRSSTTRYRVGHVVVPHWTDPDC